MSSEKLSTTAAGTVNYHESHPPRLLTLISFVYILQVARSLANVVLGAGLLGEIAVGVIYGPVAKILPLEWEETFLVIGYAGLVLIVFEGGLEINPSLFLPALPLSTLAALLGVLTPLALTFALFHAFNYPTLFAFSAGAALASTSLGTTFYVLRAQSRVTDNDDEVGSQGKRKELAETRIGVTLQAAALIDDVIALVLLAVITSLGSQASTTTSGLGWTIGRPIVASIALALGVPTFTFLVLRPLFKKFFQSHIEDVGRNAELFVGITVLSGFIAASYYAGTTPLLGAYLAGVSLATIPSSSSTINFLHTYEQLIGPLQRHIFAPLFFASIGFSIPFLQLWTGKVVWRGMVYSLLMAVGKVIVGFAVLGNDLLFAKEVNRGGTARKESEPENKGKGNTSWLDRLRRSKVVERWSAGQVVAMTTRAERNKEGWKNRPRTSNELERDGEAKNESTLGSTQASSSTIVRSSNDVLSDPRAKNDLESSDTRWKSICYNSLPAAGFLGIGLVARGEIGILILQVAVNSSSSSSGAGSRVLGEEAYLVAIWAVAMNTIVGPVLFGWWCRRFSGRIMNGPWG